MSIIKMRRFVFNLNTPPEVIFFINTYSQKFSEKQGYICPHFFVEEADNTDI